MTRSLRRSRRAPKKFSDYTVGDVVEINRNGIELRGRLAQLLTEGASPNPRWLVKFDGQPQKDEEMYEHSFGRLLESYDDEDATSDPQRKTAKPNGTTPSGRTSNSTSSEGESGEESRKIKDGNGDQNAAQLSAAEGSNVGSDDSSSDRRSARDKAARDKVSAREARSRRRQAKIDEETPASDGALGGAKRRAPTASGDSKKRQRGDESQVVKVKLLTGTLYLYRGPHRRAEFIRRV